MVQPEFDLERIFWVLGGLRFGGIGAGMCGVTPLSSWDVQINVVYEGPLAYVDSCFTVLLSLVFLATLHLTLLIGSLFMTFTLSIRRFAGFTHSFAESYLSSWRIGFVSEIWASR